MRRLAYWPEAASALAGAAVPHGLGVVWWWLHPRASLEQTLVLIAFVSALLCALAYRPTERAHMWRHLPIYLLAFAAMQILSVVVDYFSMPGGQLPLGVWLSGMLRWIGYMSGFAVLGAAPVCLACALLHRARQKTTNQGSDNP